MRQWTGSTLLQITACRLFDTKPLPQPMQPYCQLDLSTLISMKLQAKYNIFIRENTFENIVCEMAAILCRGDELTSPPLWWRIYASVNRVSIGSDNGLSPIRRQAIIWTSAWLLSIEPLGTNFSEILTRIRKVSFTKMHLKISSAKRRPFGPRVDELDTPLRYCMLKPWNVLMNYMI